MRRVVAIVGLLGACVDTRVVSLPDASLRDSGAARLSETYVLGQTSVDVLFVVDNTSGMAKLQARVAAGIGSFLNRLASARLDWRIGVTSSDLGIAPFSGPGCTTAGDGGGLLATPRKTGCTPPTDAYLTAGNTPDPRAGFECIALLGEGGCGFERPLEAALRALTPSGMPAANKGFLRERALLLLVFVSNEDDCSAQNTRLYDPDWVSLGVWDSYRCFAHDIKCTGQAADGSLTGCASGGAYLWPVKTVAQKLKALKPSGSVFVAAFVGPSTPVKLASGTDPKVLPSCTSSTGFEAVPGIRMRELVDTLGGDGLAFSACADDLGPSLDQLARRLPTATGPYCLRHALRDPALPGCAVELRLADGTWASVPPSTGDTPGFRIAHPLLPGCANGALVFDDAARPAPGTTIRVSCDFLIRP